MKKTILAVVLLMGASAMTLQAKVDKKATASDPVVMTINGKDVTRSEFEYFYNKNNDQTAAEEKDFDQYVDMFVNYKLKVHEAYSRGVDTTEAYRTELEGYRKQLAEPYMAGEDWKERALQEVQDHRKQEVHAAHILVRVDEKASPKERAAAQAKLDSIKMDLAAGASFDSIARLKSEDPSARQNAGDLGYFSALTMVYPFEKAAFEGKVGEIVEVKSSFGLHLLKVIDKRDSRGEVMVAHIMRTFDRTKPRQVARESIKPVVDSIYQVLKNGKPFAEVAAECSDDQYTAKNGGAYPWLNGSARFPKEWLDVAFSLEKGQISEPFATDFGWHIMTLLDKRAEQPLTPEQLNQLKGQLEKDPSRVAAYKRQQEDKWLNAAGVKVNQKVLAGKNRQKTLLTIGKQAYSAQMFDDWCNEQYGDEREYVPVAEALDSWQRSLISEYQEAHLEENYPEFRNIYREYHDGLMLFEVAGEEVWNKASNDTVGLTAFFERNRKNYAWAEPRFKGAFIECAEDEALVKALKDIYENCEDIQKCADMVRAQILPDTLLTPNPKQPRFHIVNGLYAPGDNNTVDRMALKLDVPAKEPRVNMPVQMTYGRVLSDGPEVLEDVRGAVVTDYQNELEEKWVAALREKYSVVLNKAELEKLKETVK